MSHLTAVPSLATALAGTVLDDIETVRPTGTVTPLWINTLDSADLNLPGSIDTTIYAFTYICWVADPTELLEAA
jgi:hypothetical protein